MTAKKEIESFTEFIYDAQTDTTVKRDFTEEEIADLLAVRLQIANQLKEEKAKINARASALAKLAELGLTEEEIAAL